MWEVRRNVRGGHPRVAEGDADDIVSHADSTGADWKLRMSNQSNEPLPNAIRLSSYSHGAG